MWKFIKKNKTLRYVFSIEQIIPKENKELKQFSYKLTSQDTIDMGKLLDKVDESDSVY